jgi:hypothetical protein
MPTERGSSLYKVGPRRVKNMEYLAVHVQAARCGACVWYMVPRNCADEVVFRIDCRLHVVANDSGDVYSKLGSYIN